VFFDFFLYFFCTLLDQCIVFETVNTNYVRLGVYPFSKILFFFVILNVINRKFWCMFIDFVADDRDKNFSTQ